MLSKLYSQCKLAKSINLWRDKIISQLFHSFTCPGIVAWVLEILITVPGSTHTAQDAFWILGYSVLQLVANQSPDICTLLYLEGT